MSILPSFGKNSQVCQRLAMIKAVSLAAVVGVSTRLPGLVKRVGMSTSELTAMNKMGQSLKAFGQWKALISFLFGYNRAPLQSRTKLFVKFLDILYWQLKQGLKGDVSSTQSPTVDDSWFTYDIFPRHHYKIALKTMTVDEYFAKNPQVKEKIDDEIRNNVWGYLAAKRIKLSLTCPFP